MSLARILMALIRGYRLVLSPWVGRYCRFEPTCSCYSQTAIARYGAARGSYLMVKRIIRCQPFSQGGYDPVPDLNIKPKL